MQSKILFKTLKYGLKEAAANRKVCDLKEMRVIANLQFTGSFFFPHMWIFEPKEKENECYFLCLVLTWETESRPLTDDLRGEVCMVHNTQQIRKM